MKNLHLVRRLIRDAHRILIVGHINPDGDCIGSLLSLGLALRSIGKQVEMYIEKKTPEIYEFLPGVSLVHHTIKYTPDIAISVDCNTRYMLGHAYSHFKKAREIIEIDHHEFRKPFGSIQIVDKHASSVGEMIYDLLNSMRIPITKDIATNILTSILIETSSFRLPSVTPRTFKLCEKLMRTGIDYYTIIDRLFWSTTREVALLTGVCLSRCVFLRNGAVAWSSIGLHDFKKVKGKDEHVDAVADEIRAIKGVQIAVLFREKTHKTMRVSIRSKNGINVAQLAEMFGGGGHYDVAGCFLPNTKVARDQFIEQAVRLL